MHVFLGVRYCGELVRPVDSLGEDWIELKSVFPIDPRRSILEGRRLFII